VVDGLVLTSSFTEAVASQALPSSLVFGNMGQENDIGPDQDVYAYTLSEWAAFLNSAFAAWNTTGVGAAVYAAYLEDAEVNAEKAYCSINTDYGLTCGMLDIVRGATAGKPVYTYVNQWAPARNVTPGPDPIRYAYHTWDWDVICENWPANYYPGESDLALARLLQAQWRDYMADGVFSVGSGWPAAGSAGPAHTVSFVYESDGSSGAVTDYKTSQCAMWAGYGFDARFWWCD
jgi:carboxylesterase type B